MRVRLRHWLPRRRWRFIGTAAEADLLPRRLPKRGVVVVGDPAEPHWLVFECPCGSGRVMLNTDMSRRPAWRALALDPPTVHPSIDARHAGRRCHYVLVDGRVRWV